MEFRLSDMVPHDRYKILTSAVVPRPIAFVSSLSASGILNAAPFSFFNVFGADPAALVLGVNRRPGGQKDTYQNIVETGDFVINIVNFALAQRMNACSADVAPIVDEFELSGLTPQPSVLVRAPRIAQSPIQFECRLTQTVEVAAGRALILGEVLYVHVADEVLDDGGTIDQAKLDAVGRMGGHWYARTRDLFAMARPVVAS